MRKLALLAMMLVAVTAISLSNSNVAKAGFMDAMKDVAGEETKPKT